MITLGQRVRVYYNLHKQCLSVMDKKTRRVIAHLPAVHLTNCKFVVSAAGLARVRREKRKSVIAFVEGDYACIWDEGMPCKTSMGDWQQVYFNPYKVDQFVIGKTPVEAAQHVLIDDKTIYAKEVTCGQP